MAWKWSVKAVDCVGASLLPRGYHLVMHLGVSRKPTNVFLFSSASVLL
ncbi:hypothetical protein E2C01_043025 [Portunus trituberculatus]|uniref:Uncharacterized protein n=1 Tax=Portunus trituberculatus TaxID=210409 RepID=A0A5B7FV80_PORTR|nr:hypothetical protein [Portunus trituberculatus]